jgi:hypothetical protein
MDKVQIEVPEYIVESATGLLYQFDATRVGIMIDSCQPQRILKQGKAMVLTPYEHMFVSSSASSSSVCMVKSPAYYQQLQQMPLQDGVCHYLQDIKNTLLTGYHAGNNNTPHHSIEAFPHRRISRQETVRRKLPVYRYSR